jgi:hypothetical protein
LLNTRNDGSRFDGLIPYDDGAVRHHPDHESPRQLHAFDGAGERCRRERDRAGHEALHFVKAARYLRGATCFAKVKVEYRKPLFWFANWTRKKAARHERRIQRPRSDVASGLGQSGSGPPVRAYLYRGRARLFRGPNLTGYVGLCDNGGAAGRGVCAVWNKHMHGIRRNLRPSRSLI